MATAPLVPATPRETFKRLRMSHRRIIALNLRGESVERIAKALSMAEGSVRAVLRRDDCKRVLNSGYTERIVELLPRAVKTIAKHLDDGDGQVALRAADMALKLNGKYKEAEEATVTAEDVIERVLERISPDGTRTRLTERRLLRAPTQQEPSDA